MGHAMTDRATPHGAHAAMRSAPDQIRALRVHRVRVEASGRARHPVMATSG